MKRVLIFLFLCCSSLSAQTYTTPWKFPVWNFRDTVKSGSLTDTTLVTGTPGKNYLNLLSTRANAFFNRYFDRQHDTLRNVLGIRLLNGFYFTGDTSTGNLNYATQGFVTRHSYISLSSLSALSPLSYNSSTGVFSADTGAGKLATKTDLLSYVPTTRTIGTNSPLSGGGDLSTNRTLSIDTSTVGTGVTTLYKNSLNALAATTITVAGTSPIISSAGPQSLASNRTWTISTADTILSKGAVWTSTVGFTVLDSVAIWTADRDYTLRSIKVDREGGTTLTINAVRIRSGSQVDLLAANFSTSANSWTTAFEDAGTVQNTSISAGDKIAVCMRSISGTVNKLSVQLNFLK